MAHTILVADDSATIQTAIEIAFDKEPYSVVKVGNGLDAVAQARSLQPSLVLADHLMPGKTGYEVAEALRADPATSHIPVLMLSGTAASFDEFRCHQSGAVGHIAKPFDCHSIIDKVNEIVRATDQRHAATPPPTNAAAHAPQAGVQPSPPVSNFGGEPQRATNLPWTPTGSNPTTSHANGVGSRPQVSAAQDDPTAVRPVPTDLLQPGSGQTEGNWQPAATSSAAAAIPSAGFPPVQPPQPYAPASTGVMAETNAGVSSGGLSDLVGQVPESTAPLGGAGARNLHPPMASTASPIVDQGNFQPPAPQVAKRNVPDTLAQAVPPSLMASDSGRSAQSSTMQSATSLSTATTQPAAGNDHDIDLDLDFDQFLADVDESLISDVDVADADVPSAPSVAAPSVAAPSVAAPATPPIVAPTMAQPTPSPVPAHREATPLSTEAKKTVLSSVSQHRSKPEVSSAPPAQKSSSVSVLLDDALGSSEGPVEEKPAVAAAASQAIHAAAEDVAQLVSGGGGLAASNLSRQDLEAQAREVIERVVWEVVPTLAETLIREEIARLLAKNENA